MLVPHHVHLCPVRTGGSDLFAHVVAPPGVGEVSWSLSGAGVEASGREPVGPTGRAAVAHVLPAGVDRVTVDVRAGAATATVEAHAYVQPVELRLPLAGQVLVVGGHRLGEVHRSAWEVPSQAFAWDLVPLADSTLALLAVPWSGGRLSSDAFAGFGMPVVAPAEGTVVTAVDGMPDTAAAGELPDADAFRRRPTLAAGNHVVVDHGAGLHSVLAHLRQGSVEVACGDRIRAGGPLAQLGSSGFSSGPHLHLHFMDGPSLLDASPLPVLLAVDGLQLDPQAGEIVASE